MTSPNAITADPAIVGAWITAIATVTAVIVAAGFAYRHASDHNRRAHNTAIRVDRLRREIDALERIWGLLAYMTFAEGQYAIVRYREDRQKRSTYYVNLPNLRQFILTVMPTAFYTEHAGLHLPAAIRDQVFDYTGSLMGLYLRYENAEPAADAAIVALENQNLVDKLRNAYQQLNSALKEELNERYRQMLAADSEGR